VTMEVYEAYPFNGVDATIVTVTVDGVVMLTAIDPHPNRPMYVINGVSPVLVSSGANTRANFANFTAYAIASPLRIGFNNFFAANLQYAQYPFVLSNYGKSLKCTYSFLT
jgi:hypothetical protein